MHIQVCLSCESLLESYLPTVFGKLSVLVKSDNHHKNNKLSYLSEKLKTDSTILLAL